LFVAHLDVAPGQEKEQLAIGPDVFEAEYGPSITRLDDDERLGRETNFRHDYQDFSRLTGFVSTGSQYILSILKNPVNPA
jgi:hypothetical protein